MICEKLETCVFEEFSGLSHSNCDNPNALCIESSDRRSEIKCKEKGKKYILCNTQNNHIISYRVDGGIIVLDTKVPPETDKCDYLFVDNAEELIAIMIELKGVDVPKALKQLSNTLLLFKDFFKNCGHVYGRIIVASSTPNLKACPAYVNLEKILRKTYHGNIKIKKQQYSEKDVELAKN